MPAGRRGWDCDDVAAHLLDRRAALVRSLAPRSPWGGIDLDTLNELYIEAAAKVARIAASRQRPDWRTHRDLERAIIAAFRFEAQHYWRTVKTQKRRGDRDAILFDPELHAEHEESLARILEASPHEELVARDWLAQLQGDVRSLWALLLQGTALTDAGEQLGLSYRQCQILYRAGLEQLGRFRALQEAGKVCQLRAPAIAAWRAGTADELTTERAQAHLACCLPCALVHQQGASALRRGIFHVLPLPGVVRTLTRVRELVGDRAAEAAAAGGATGVGGAFMLGNGATALLCAGALAGGACVAGIGPIPSPFTEHHPRHVAHHAAPIAARSQGTSADALAAPPLSNTLTAAAPITSRTQSVSPRARTSEFGKPAVSKPKQSPSAPTTAQTTEFSPENAASTASSSPSTSTSPTASSASTASSTPSSSSSKTTTSSSPGTTPTSSSEFGGP